jgi:Flp pilus assembly protein TadG
MKHHGVSFLLRFLRDQRGQSAVVLAVSILVTATLGGAAIEAGHVYYAYQRLEASTNAAALAAGQVMPNIGTSSSPAAGTAYYNLYKYSSDTSSTPTGLNANTLLSGAAISMTFDCSSNVSTHLNVACQSPTSGSCGGALLTCNTIKVTQTASVNLWFGGLLGIRTFNLTAVSYAAIRGGSDTPYNIAVIIDTTNSMTSSAPSGDGCGSGASQINCAVAGLKAMLQDMDPCPLNEICPGNSAYVDGVSLFTFPAVTETTNSHSVAAGPYDDTTCPTSNPPIVPYSFTNVATTGGNLTMPSSPATYSAIAGTYELMAFDDGYRNSDSAGTLYSGDGLASAVGYETSGSCSGLQAPGGEGTYYAQAIYAAQVALKTQQNSFPGSKNIMIILSDGNATACNTQAYTADISGSLSCTHGSELVAVNCPAVNSSGVCVANTTSSYGGVSIDGTAATLQCPGYTSPSSPGTCSGPPLNGTGTSTTNHSGYNVATYPSALGECGQAVQAAQAATAAGTTVYTIAMGSPTSGGCQTDQTVTLTSGSTHGAEGYPAGTYSGQPCNAIAAMASNENTFYSDNTAGCAALVNNQPQFETIGGIFQAIANSLTNSRLIPSGDF